MRRLICIILFLTILPAWCVPAYVNSISARTGGADCVMALSVTAGNTLLVAGGGSASGATLTVSDTDTNSYTASSISPFVGGAARQVAIWTAPVSANNATLSITLHTDNTGAAVSCAAIQYSGLASSSVEDKAATAYYEYTPSVDLASGTSATTTVASEILVGIFLFTSTVELIGATEGAGYTIRQNRWDEYNSQLLVEDQVVSSTGAYQATATLAATAASASEVIVTLKGATAASPRRRVIIQ